MFNIGQVLRDKEKNAPVIYCGFIIDMEGDDAAPGVYIFRKDSQQMEVVPDFLGLAPYGEYPNIDIGTFVSDIGMEGQYFGLMRDGWWKTPHNHTSALHALEEAERRYHGGVK